MSKLHDNEQLFIIKLLMGGVSAGKEVVMVMVKEVHN